MSLFQVISGSIETVITNATVTIPLVLNKAADSPVGRTFRSYDDSYARLQLIRAEDKVALATQGLDQIENNDATGEASSIIDYISILNSAESFVERMSPTYTFGQSLIFTAGSDAKNFVYSGFVLITDQEGDNKARLEGIYENFLRATANVEAEEPTLVRLTYRDQTREGYLTSLKLQIDSIVQARVPISFSMFVVNQYGI